MTTIHESASETENALHSFADGIWIIDGEPVRDMGIRFPTRMTIVKLTDGSLWISSPVPQPKDIMKEIEAIGPVRYLVVGTPRHVWRLESWHNLYPDAEIWVPPQLGKKRKSLMVVGDSSLEFTGILSDVPPDAWKDDLVQVVLHGSSFIEELLFYHKKSHTLIIDDLIQNYSKVKGKPVRNALISLLGMSYPSGGVSIDIKLSFIHRDLARQSLEKILSWDFDKLILAHGICVENDAKDFFKRAFKWLVK